MGLEEDQRKEEIEMRRENIIGMGMNHVRLDCYKIFVSWHNCIIDFVLERIQEGT